MFVLARLSLWYLRFWSAAMDPACLHDRNRPLFTREGYRDPTARFPVT